MRIKAASYKGKRAQVWKSGLVYTPTSNEEWVNAMYKAWYRYLIPPFTHLCQVLRPSAKQIKLLYCSKQRAQLRWSTLFAPFCSDLRIQRSPTAASLGVYFRKKMAKSVQKAAQILINVVCAGWGIPYVKKPKFNLHWFLLRKWREETVSDLLHGKSSISGITNMVKIYTLAPQQLVGVAESDKGSHGKLQSSWCAINSQPSLLHK